MPWGLGMEAVEGMSENRRMDILYGKVNALEIVAEELFAELIRSVKDPAAVLKNVASRLRAIADELVLTKQPIIGVAGETKENVARIIQNLSISLSGNTQPRSRGS